MTDKYVEKQTQALESATSEAHENDVLYRLGTYLEIIPCNGNAEDASQHKQEIVDTANQVLQGNAPGTKEEED